MAIPLYEIQAEFTVVWQQHQGSKETVAICEEATGHRVKTWNYIDKGDRLRVLFITKCVTEARYICAVLNASQAVKAEGLAEVKFVEKPTMYVMPPYRFRLGSKVLAVNDVHGKFTSAARGTTGIVYTHDGPYDYRVLFENGDPDGRLIPANIFDLRGVTEDAPATVQNEVLIE